MPYKSAAHNESVLDNSSKTEDIPDGHVGLCNAHVCTISLAGVKETYLPLTPPPKRRYSDPGWASD